MCPPEDWIHLAEFAVRKSHPLHGEVELPPHTEETFQTAPIDRLFCFSARK
jgi:hypothetical protein